MKDIPSDILIQFSGMLKKRSVPTSSYSYYVKWLRYYLDYCAKYNLPDKSSKNLTQFLLKLRDKKQPEEQQRQAGHAVSLYLDMMKATARLQSVSECPASVHTHARNTLPPVAAKESKGPQQPANDETKPPIASAEVIGQPLIFKQYSATSDVRIQWKKAIAEMTAVIKTKHYSVKTLKSYSHWVWKFQSYRQDMDPLLLGSEDDVKAFLSWLAVSCNVSASSQNQAFNAVLFFFRHVLKKDFGEIRDVVRAKRRPYIPVVLSRDEVATVIGYCFFSPDTK